MQGKKRLTALVLSLIVLLLRRAGLDEELSGLIVEILISAGLVAHVVGLVVDKRKADAVRRAGPLLLVLAALSGGCAETELRQCRLEVSRSDASLDALRCEGHEAIKVPRLDPVLRQCVLVGAELSK